MFGKGIYCCGSFCLGGKIGEAVETISRIGRQFRDALMHNTLYMLPFCFNRLFHRGELRCFLTLDAGGSAFRKAMVDTQGNNMKIKIATFSSRK